jgi:hypothetical protein
MRRLSWIIQWVLNVVSRGDLRQKAMHLLKHCAVLLGLKGRSTSQGRQATEAGKGDEMDSLQDLQSKGSPAPTWIYSQLDRFQISDIQSSKRINVYCF